MRSDASLREPEDGDRPFGAKRQVCLGRREGTACASLGGAGTRDAQGLGNKVVIIPAMAVNDIMVARCAAPRAGRAVRYHLPRLGISGSDLWAGGKG